jgi:predicted nuclease with TOPRIM domain
MEKITTMLIGILLALAGWSLSRTFELSTSQAVLLDKVERLEIQSSFLEEKLSEMADSDEEIMKQHEKLFQKLDQGNTGYNYN